MNSFYWVIILYKKKVLVYIKIEHASNNRNSHPGERIINVSVVFKN